MYNKNVVTPHLLYNTPFLNRCDGNRLQIAASQARQALPLKHSEPAYVVTGYEKSYNPDKVYADIFGQVILVTTKAIVIRNDEGDVRIIRVYPQDKVVVQEGEYVTPEDVVKVKDHYFFSEELTQGVNLVCAVMSHPLAFEDAFVISESGVKKLSAYVYDTITLELSNDEVIDFELVLPGKVHNEFRLIKKSLSIIGNDKELLYEPYQVEIRDLTVIPTEDFDSVSRIFFLKVKEYVKELRDKLYALEDLIGKTKTIRLVNIHRAFDGSKQTHDIEKDVYFKIDYRKLLPLTKGDKLTNRHAAKGVVGLIVPDDEMPVLPDGRRAEIILNPMAVPSRMNISQLYEIAANKALYHFKQKINFMVEHNEDIERIKQFVIDFYSLMAENEPLILETVKQELEYVTDVDEFELIDWRFVAPSFTSVSCELLEKMLDMVVDDQYVIDNNELTVIEDRSYLKEKVEVTAEIKAELEKLYRHLDPHLLDKVIKDSDVYKVDKFATPVFYRNRIHLINADYLYFYRLVHNAVDKINARSFIDYDAIGPSKDIRSAQRFGEMEAWTLIAYGALDILEEFWNEKADNFPRKINYIIEKMTNKEQPDIIGIQESIKLLKAYLLTIGIDIVELPDVFNIDFTIEKIKELTKRKEEMVTDDEEESIIQFDFDETFNGGSD